MSEVCARSGLSVVLALLVTLPAFADDSVSLPDPSLTPGAIAETHTAMICVVGYSLGASHLLRT
jgi:hypothetical protein